MAGWSQRHFRFCTEHSGQQGREGPRRPVDAGLCQGCLILPSVLHTWQGPQVAFHFLSWASTPWCWDPAHAHQRVTTRRWHSCLCSSVMASGITSVSPGRHGMACGKHSRTGRSWAPATAWPPGTPSSRAACSSSGRSRWVPPGGSFEGHCLPQAQPLWLTASWTIQAVMWAQGRCGAVASVAGTRLV